MNERKKNIVYNLAPYILLFLITTAILFTVYAIKGIFPFGDSSITYADFAQSYVPQFYHYWDALHGLKDPFFDWYSGTGISMVSTDMLSPFNIFFLFIPRESILDSMSFFLVLKVVVSAICFYLFVNKVFNKIDIGYKIGFAVLYSMSGYVLQYYSNIKWLDIVAVFPLLMLGFYYLMKKEKILLYTISLTIIMLENFYVSVQVLIFLLFTGGLYIILMVNKNEKKHKSFSLALGTVLGVGLSMFKTLPTFLTLMGSSRGEGNASKNYFDIINVVFKDKLTTNDMNKWFMFMGLELAVLLCIILIARFIKHKRATLFFVGEMLIVCLPIIFEGTNKLWHTGSYTGFPMRSAFTIAFVFITGACYCINYESEYKQSKRLNTDFTTEIGCTNKLLKVDTESDFESVSEKEETELDNVYKKENKVKALFIKLKNNIVVSVIVSIVAIVLVCCTIPWLLEASNIIQRYGSYFLNTQDYAIPKAYLMAAIVLIAALILILFTKKSKLKSLCIILAVVIPLSVSTYSFIGVKTYVYPEQNPQFIKDAENINDVLPQGESVLNRVKNDDNSLNTNYPFILQRGALSNWTHTVSGDSIKAMKSMGYSSAYTRMLDTGGTLLTDAVMGIKNVITKQVLTEPAYTLQQKAGEYNYYTYNYSLPTCLVANSTIANIQTNSAEIAKTNNLLYHSFSSDTENIMEILEPHSKLGCFYNVSPKVNGLKYIVKVTGDKMLYFKSAKKNISITINGKAVAVPTYLSENKILYPSEFNNNVLSLGNFTDEIVTIEFTGGTLTENDIILYAFDINKLSNLCNEYKNNYDYVAFTNSSSLEVEVNTHSDSNMLFVPVSYDKSWTATVNGKPVKIEPAVNDGFMAVPLENGVNNVCLQFSPNAMSIGSVISLMMLAVLILLVWLKEKKSISRPPQAVSVISQCVLYIVWFIALIGVYIVPIIYEIFFATGK